MKRKVTGAWKLITRNDHKKGDKSNIKYYSSKDNNNSYFPWVTLHGCDEPYHVNKRKAQKGEVEIEALRNCACD